MRARLSFAGLALVVFAGCTANTSSRNIRTAGMVALIDVSSSNSGQSTVGMKLVVGGANSNTYVVLEQGDSVSATAAGQTQAMQAVSAGEYEVRFPTAEGEFVVTLTRSADQEELVSSGTMPPPFELTTAFPSEAIPRTEPVTIEWAPAGSQAQVSIEADGDCIFRDKFTTGDTGSFTIPAGKLKAWKSKANQDCKVDLTVTRTVAGQAASGFDSDSRFLLHQVRKTHFVSGPEPKAEEKPAKEEPAEERPAPESAAPAVGPQLASR
jgi:hypothetical protein